MVSLDFYDLLTRPPARHRLVLLAAEHAAIGQRVGLVGRSHSTTTARYEAGSHYSVRRVRRGAGSGPL